MSASQVRLYLISYDISDPRRLHRVYAFLKRHAMPVQYSVFLAWLSERRLLSLLGEINRRIDPRCDDVRAYPLLADCKAVTTGRLYFPDGVVSADPLLNYLLGSREPLQEAERECDKDSKSGEEGDPW
ncbi:MAG: CRISPR-associated endonuclease Cas2 [Bryobacteraceae bacterium]